MAVNTSRIRIEAPAWKVWEALTLPELVKEWQYGSQLLTDWQVGGEIRFRIEWEGNVFEQWGKVLEVSPHDTIRYTLFAPRPGLEDRPENDFVMSYLLKEESNGTLLTIEQEDNRAGAVSQESDEDDGQTVLSMLKNLVETSA